jgi:hypothetical protein
MDHYDEWAILENRRASSTLSGRGGALVGEQGNNTTEEKDDSDDHSSVDYIVSNSVNSDENEEDDFCQQSSMPGDDGHNNSDSVDMVWGEDDLVPDASPNGRLENAINDEYAVNEVNGSDRGTKHDTDNPSDIMDEQMQALSEDNDTTYSNGMLGTDGLANRVLDDEMKMSHNNDPGESPALNATAAQYLDNKESEEETQKTKASSINSLVRSNRKGAGESQEVVININSHQDTQSNIQQGVPIIRSISGDDYAVNQVDGDRGTTDDTDIPSDTMDEQMPALSEDNDTTCSNGLLAAGDGLEHQELSDEKKIIQDSDPDEASAIKDKAHHPDKRVFEKTQKGKVSSSNSPFRQRDTRNELNDKSPHSRDGSKIKGTGESEKGFNKSQDTPSTIEQDTPMQRSMSGESDSSSSSSCGGAASLLLAFSASQPPVQLPSASLISSIVIQEGNVNKGTTTPDKKQFISSDKTEEDENKTICEVKCATKQPIESLSTRTQKCFKDQSLRQEALCAQHSSSSPPSSSSRIDDIITTISHSSVFSLLPGPDNTRQGNTMDAILSAVAPHPSTFKSYNDDRPNRSLQLTEGKDAKTSPTIAITIEKNNTSQSYYDGDETRNSWASCASNDLQNDQERADQVERITQLLTDPSPMAFSIETSPPSLDTSTCTSIPRPFLSCHGGASPMISGDDTRTLPPPESTLDCLQVARSDSATAIATDSRYCAIHLNATEKNGRDPTSTPPSSTSLVVFSTGQNHRRSNETTLASQTQGANSRADNKAKANTSCSLAIYRSNNKNARQIVPITQNNRCVYQQRLFLAVLSLIVMECQQKQRCATNKNTTGGGDFCRSEPSPNEFHMPVLQTRKEQLANLLVAASKVSTNNRKRKKYDTPHDSKNAHPHLQHETSGRPAFTCVPAVYIGTEHGRRNYAGEQGIDNERATEPKLKPHHLSTETWWKRERPSQFHLQQNVGHARHTGCTAQNHIAATSEDEDAPPGLATERKQEPLRQDVAQMHPTTRADIHLEVKEVDGLEESFALGEDYSTRRDNGTTDEAPPTDTSNLRSKNDGDIHAKCDTDTSQQRPEKKRKRSSNKKESKKERRKEKKRRKKEKKRKKKHTHQAYAPVELECSDADEQIITSAPAQARHHPTASEFGQRCNLSTTSTSDEAEVSTKKRSASCRASPNAKMVDVVHGATVTLEAPAGGALKTRCLEPSGSTHETNKRARHQSQHLDASSDKREEFRRKRRRDGSSLMDKGSLGGREGATAKEQPMRLNNAHGASRKNPNAASKNFDESPIAHANDAPFLAVPNPYDEVDPLLQNHRVEDDSEQSKRARPAETTDQHQITLRLLCSERFLETFGHAVTTLASGSWTNALNQDSSPMPNSPTPQTMIPAGIPISFCDSPVMDIAGVDIEILTNGGILCVSAMDWQQQQQQQQQNIQHQNQGGVKMCVRHLVQVISTSRYKHLHVFVVCDMQFLDQQVLCQDMSTLQTTVMFQEQDRCHVFVEIVSPSSLAYHLANTILMAYRAGRDTTETGMITEGSGKEHEHHVVSILTDGLLSDDEETAATDSGVHPKIEWLLNVAPSFNMPNLFLLFRHCFGPDWKAVLQTISLSRLTQFFCDVASNPSQLTELSNKGLDVRPLKQFYRVLHSSLQGPG